MAPFSGKTIVRTVALINDAKHIGLDAHQATISVAFATILRDPVCTITGLKILSRYEMPNRKTAPLKQTRISETLNSVERWP
jgi:hypothetical protein